MPLKARWITLLLIATASFQASANLINGSFDNPALNTGGPLNWYWENEVNVPGWNTTATDNQIEFWDAGFAGYTGHDGKQFIELNADQVSTVYQDISSFAAGQKIDFNFAHRGREGVDTVRFSITDQSTNAVLFTQDYSTGAVAWAEYDSSLASIIATGNTLRIAFESISNANDQTTYGNFIDGVTVTAVPLPPSLLLFLLGLSSLYLTNNRRSKA